jgi:hypothetical protein
VLATIASAAILALEAVALDDGRSRDSHSALGSLVKQNSADAGGSDTLSTNSELADRVDP